jgi:outer membrane lipoprotein-sorting protein
MKKNIFLFAVLLFSLPLLSQEEELETVPKLEKDPATKKILDKISAKAKSYESMRLKFLYEFEDLAKKEKNQKEGIIYIKKEKFKLFLKDTGVEIMFDGKTQATYSRTETQEGELIEEVIYSYPDTTEKGVLTPSNIYTFYQDNFFYRTVGNEMENGVKLTVIDFIPENKKVALSKVRLRVNEKTNEIYSAKSFSKSGERLTFTIIELKPNIKVIDKLFIFDEAANPNAEVIDLRE